MSQYPVPRQSQIGRPLEEEGSLRMAPFRELPQLLSEMGLDPSHIIAEAGFVAALFDDPDNVISYADAGRLLALSAASTRCEHLGLLLGQRAGLDVLGLVGSLASQCADVGSALRNAILYLHLHDRGAVPTLWVSGERAVLAYTLCQPDVPGTELIYDAAVAITYNVVRDLAGLDWRPSEVRLIRARPKNIEPYRRFYRTVLCFGAEQSAVVFPAYWLDHPLDGADAMVHREIMREIEALEAQGAGDLATQLKRVLRRMLIGGACQGETCLERVADLFAIHRRTLNRRLRVQGTSFKALIDETRYDIARQLLRDTHLPVAQVAAALDYSETASFDHAFRRWSGISPAAWREANVGV